MAPKGKQGAKGGNSGGGVTTDPDAPMSEEEAAEMEANEETTLEGLLQVEALAIELGVDLIGLVDETAGGNLVERISRIRRDRQQTAVSSS